MADLPGWSYYKIISVTGEAGAGTDYQIKLEIGDSGGGDFHLEGHCTNFPQDIRITDDDGTTLLNHWIEDLTADPIIVHVKVDDDLGTNQNIRVYYGKSEETTLSNGVNTFIQYYGASTANFLSALEITIPFVWEGRFKRSSGSSETGECYFGVSNKTVVQTGDATYFNTYTDNNRMYGYARNDAASSYGYLTPKYTTDVFYEAKIEAISSSLITLYPLRTGSSFDLTTNIPDAAMGLMMYERTVGGEQAWSFVREYNDPEPAFNSAGAEQTPGTGTSNTGALMMMLMR